LLAAAAAGTLLGAFAFAFEYGDGSAYLSNDPRACANCHVMLGHFDSWQKSRHHHVAVCNDCHLPPGFAGKWLTKLDNGTLHSLAFTLGGFPDPIRIKPRNARRTQRACLGCHSELAHALAPVEAGGDMLACVHCHADAGHALR
jgi:cytochrome c nitrite reductase small subunit